jgi:malate synthase
MQRPTSSIVIDDPGQGPDNDRILTPEAVEFLAELHRRFDNRRLELLRRREDRQALLNAGQALDFLAETEDLRRDDWTVAPAPPELVRRGVEITGPTDRKMVINALNSGAGGFMADFEDANSPTWENIISGQGNLVDALAGTIEYEADDGRIYRLAENPATLLVRPRGWHLPEKHLTVDGEMLSGALVDFGLYAFHNAPHFVARGSGPYLYLPKMESHFEARLWADVFAFAEGELGLEQGSIKVTALIETLPAAFEMDEILFELRAHSAALNAGRWDYIFSTLKCMRERPDAVLPDRAQVTMTVPFMRAYSELLVKTCHRRGAHAMGGMAAFVPSRRDAEVNEKALAAVRADKTREAIAGFDGTWVAHPDLVPVASDVFDRAFGESPNQLEVLRRDVSVGAAELLNVGATGGTITEAGLRNNISVAIQYLASWLDGRGAVAINNLMEDAATAEIARTQVWQWVTHDATLADSTRVTADLVRRLADDELATLRAVIGDAAYERGEVNAARELFERVALDSELAEFLTIPAYALLD